MSKFVLLGLVLVSVLGGCARNPQTDLAVRKFLVGYNGLSCSERYQAFLDDGDTREVAEADYQRCVAERS